MENDGKGNPKHTALFTSRVGSIFAESRTNRTLSGQTGLWTGRAEPRRPAPSNGIGKPNQALPETDIIESEQLGHCRSIEKPSIRKSMVDTTKPSLAQL